MVISGGQFQFVESNSFQNTTLVNVDLLQQEGIAVYPTVSEGRIKVKMNHSAPGAWNVGLRNQLGQLLSQQQVESQGTFNFDFSEFAAGIYTLQFQNGNQVEVKKIVLR